jgi:plasmid maintenance system antidote protein VapI
MAEARGEGMTMQALADVLGVTRQRVYTLLERHD